MPKKKGLNLLRIPLKPLKMIQIMRKLNLMEVVATRALIPGFRLKPTTAMQIVALLAAMGRATIVEAAAMEKKIPM